MYARSTSVRGNPKALDDGIFYVRTKVVPAVGQMDGCIGLSMLADRESGRSIVTTAWTDADAMHRSAEEVVAIRQKAGEILEGESTVREWEIAVLHRRHETHNGAFARVIWTQGDPAELDSLIGTFRTGVVPRMEHLPGFDSCSVLVDRSRGRVVTSMTYDSRHSMDEAERMSAALGEDVTVGPGRGTTGVAAYDVVVAHLRVPETV
jgi:quinol monooxygenase YgiN